MEHITKIPGTYEEVSIHCPKCNSKEITVAIDSRGYYEVIECYECGYQKEK